MDFEITGHSGCQIEIVREDGRLVVLKTTDKPSYADRLYQQALKQQAFCQQHQSYVCAPKVLDISFEPHFCAVKMEFIYAQNFIEFFEYSGLEKLNSFIEMVLLFIEEEIDRSSIQRVEESVVLHKYRNVKKKILANSSLVNDPDIQNVFEDLDAILDLKRHIILPIGMCHGDLTLSNILFSGNKVYFVDFLDSFIETPLMDIVKLRQDTRYGWSFLMFKRQYDHVRHQIILDYVDKHIAARFQEFPFYRDNYMLFQLMNFLRILQYANKSRVIAYLKGVIKQLVNEYDN